MAATGAFRKVLARQGTEVGSLSFSPDGKTVLAGAGAKGNDTDCHVYDVASGREIVTYSGHDNIVLATAISPDGRWAATGGGDKEEIHLWDLRERQAPPWPRRPAAHDGRTGTAGLRGRVRHGWAAHCLGERISRSHAQ